MNHKQFETMAAIRAYAKQIAEQIAEDTRPSTARFGYVAKTARMHELCKALEAVS